MSRRNSASDAAVARRNLNILFISDVYFPCVNGISTSIRSFAAELRALGHTVHLLAPADARAVDDEDWVTRLPARASRLSASGLLLRTGASMRQLDALRRARYDLIHVHTPFAARRLGRRLARRLGIPCVATHHTRLVDELRPALPWLPARLLHFVAARMTRWQGNGLRALVAPSPPVQALLRQCGVRVPIEVVATGLAAADFVTADGSAFRRRHGIAADAPLLLYLGRLAAEKNIGFLLRVSAQLRHALPRHTLLIAGEGPLRAELERDAAALGIAPNVRFIGNLDRHGELQACYRAADVLVFASRAETQGLVVLEALAQGTPVVALAELGTQAVLREEVGALAAAADETAFAARVAALLRDPAWRRELGEAARSHAVTCWMARAQTMKLVDFYRGLLV